MAEEINKKIDEIVDDFRCILDGVLGIGDRLLDDDVKKLKRNAKDFYYKYFGVRYY